MERPNLNKIIAGNLDKAKFQSKSSPVLPTNGWLDQYKEGGTYISDRAKATQFGQYKKGGTTSSTICYDPVTKKPVPCKAGAHKTLIFTENPAVTAPPEWLQGKKIEEEINNNEFTKEAEDLKNYLITNQPGEDIEVYPTYRNNDDKIVTSRNKTLNQVLAGSDSNTRLAFMAHHGSNLFGRPYSELGKQLQGTNYDNCYLGSCYSGDIASSPEFNKLTNFHFRPGYPWLNSSPSLKEGLQWLGVNPNKNSETGEAGVNNAFFNTTYNLKKYNDSRPINSNGIVSEDYINPPSYITKNPIQGVDYQINNPTNVPHRMTLDNPIKYNTLDIPFSKPIIPTRRQPERLKMGGGMFPEYHSYVPPRMKNGGPKPKYEQWIKTVNPDYISNDYNLRDAYNELPYKLTKAWAKDPERNHLPDTYKLPNHPTFSNESKYYDGFTPGVGGYWGEGDENYIKNPLVGPPMPYAKFMNQYKNGGGLLSRTVTCSNCGWSWKAVDGGKDVMTCHKCGGMIKMKEGGSSEPGPGYFKNYLNKMNQDYRNWYSTPRPHDDGFDSYYYNNLQQQRPTITTNAPAWEITNANDPSIVTYEDGEELSPQLKKKLAQGKITAKFIKDHPTTEIDNSLDSYNTELTRYLRENNTKAYGGQTNWLDQYDDGGLTTIDTTKPEGGFGCKGKSCTMTGEGIKKEGVRGQPSDEGSGGYINYAAFNAPINWSELINYNNPNTNDLSKNQAKNTLKAYRADAAARAASLQDKFPGLTQDQILAAIGDLGRITQRRSDTARYNKPSEQTFDKAYHNFYQPLINQSTPVTAEQVLQFISQQPGGLQGYQKIVEGNYGRPKKENGGEWLNQYATGGSGPIGDFFRNLFGGKGGRGSTACPTGFCGKFNDGTGGGGGGLNIGGFLGNITEGVGDVLEGVFGGIDRIGDGHVRKRKCEERGMEWDQETKTCTSPTTGTRVQNGNNYGNNYFYMIPSRNSSQVLVTTTTTVLPLNGRMGQSQPNDLALNYNPAMKAQSIQDPVNPAPNPGGALYEGNKTVAKYGGSSNWLKQYAENGLEVTTDTTQYPQPTSSDSLRLYNSQLALNNFYNKEVKSGRFTKGNTENVYYSNNDFKNNLKILKQENLNYYRGEINARNNNYGLRTSDKDYKKYYNLSPEQVTQLELKGLGQTKSGNEYQSYYRDLITPLQNLAAPFALVDSRIVPQQKINYFSTYMSGNNIPGGNVSVFDYDPLAIKPWAMKTPQEKIEWQKKYGKNIGSHTFVSKIQVKQQPKKSSSVIVGNQKDFNKINSQSPLIRDKDGIYRNDIGQSFKFADKLKPIVKKQSIPTQQTVVQQPIKQSIPVQQVTPVQTQVTPGPTSIDYTELGSPIYAQIPMMGGTASGAFVGYRTKDGQAVYVKPEDYQRMGVDRNGREYIEAQTKKQKYGGTTGWLKQYAPGGITEPTPQQSRFHPEWYEEGINPEENNSSTYNQSSSFTVPREQFINNLKKQGLYPVAFNTSKGKEKKVIANKSNKETQSTDVTAPSFVTPHQKFINNLQQQINNSVDPTIFNNANPKWKQQLYEPTQKVKNAKAILSGIDLVSSPFVWNPAGWLVNRIASTANATGDAYTSARYFMDGQWQNGLTDLAEAGLDLIPLRKGKPNTSWLGKGELMLSKTDKSLNKLLRFVKGIAYADDFKDVAPSSKKENGGETKWLTKYAPGGVTTDTTTKAPSFVLSNFSMPKLATESTAITLYNPVLKRNISTATSGQNAEDMAASNKQFAVSQKIKANQEAKRVAERKAAIAAKDKGKQFTLPTGQTKKYADMDFREKSYVAGKALENRGRFFENEESIIDDFNPLNWIGQIAGDLAQAPYEAKQSNSNIPYVSAIASPLIQGALGFNPLGSAIKFGSSPLAKSAGRFLTEQTALKNAYTINPYLKNPFGFKNIGDTPHWLKGYTKELNPETIDLSSGFKEYQTSINKNYNNLNKLFEKKKISYDDLISRDNNYISTINKNTPFGKNIGEGAYGTVYEFKNYPDKVIKYGKPFNGRIITQDFIDRLAQFQNQGNIAIPLRAKTFEVPHKWKGYKPPTYEISIMDNLNNVKTTPLNLSKRDQYALFLKQARKLRDAGAELDVANSENLKFNKDKGVYDIYDISNSSNVANMPHYLTYVNKQVKKGRFIPDKIKQPIYKSKIISDKQINFWEHPDFKKDNPNFKIESYLNYVKSSENKELPENMKARLIRDMSKEEYKKYTSELRKFSRDYWEGLNRPKQKQGGSINWLNQYK